LADPQYLGFQGAKLDDLEYTPAILPTVVDWPLDRTCSMKIHEISGIDKWFLYKLKNIVEMYKKLQGVGFLFGLNTKLLLSAKKIGFSVKQIAVFVRCTEDEVVRPSASTPGSSRSRPYVTRK
jgi:carbamoyl-phosphate synthase large subunit